MISTYTLASKALVRPWKLLPSCISDAEVLCSRPIPQHCMEMAAGSLCICPGHSWPNRDHFTGTRRGKHNVIADILHPSPKALRVYQSRHFLPQLQYEGSNANMSFASLSTSRSVTYAGARLPLFSRLWLPHRVLHMTASLLGISFVTSTFNTHSH